MTQNGFTDRDTHEGIERESWNLLVKGAHKSKEDFHWPVYGTLGNQEPELRTVVLREAIRESKTLIVHTDIRSEKIEQIRQNPKIGLLFYDHRRKIQLRIKAVAEIHHQDQLAADQWRKTSLSSRKAYLGKSPGNLSLEATHGLPEALAGNVPDAATSEAGYENFAVLENRVTFIDWLWLYREGHRRAQFTYLKDGTWNANWVVP